MRPETIGPATEGVTTAYYLIHSMEEGGAPFEERDRTAATNFARAAASSGVERIVFLGGLGDDEDPDLSPHLASRHETGRLLAEHGPAVLELRAGMVIGAGSASFRMLEDLVRRLPVMVTPRWVDTRSQPIAIDDVVAYLDGAREVTLDEHHTIVEIGGADVLSYREMMRCLGAMRGRVPVILPVPVLSPSLSSLWCGLVTSVLLPSRGRSSRDSGTRRSCETTRRRGSSPTPTRSASTRPSRGSADPAPPWGSTAVRTGVARASARSSATWRLGPSTRTPSM
jgi:uncharacterized protein YbjT (DUF2867 family)